jgi:hypothetical protein
MSDRPSSSDHSSTNPPSLPRRSQERRATAIANEALAEWRQAVDIWIILGDGIRAPLAQAEVDRYNWLIDLLDQSLIPDRLLQGWVFNPCTPARMLLEAEAHFGATLHHAEEALTRQFAAERSTPRLLTKPCSLLTEPSPFLADAPPPLFDPALRDPGSPARPHQRTLPRSSPS